MKKRLNVDNKRKKIEKYYKNITKTGKVYNFMQTKDEKCAIIELFLGKKTKLEVHII